MAIKDRAVSGMSFRFEVIREEWRDIEGKTVREDELMQLLWNPGERGPLKRTLKEVRMHELGPVVFPAYAGTSVDVRSKSLASLVMEDSDLTREVRSALASNNTLRLNDKLANEEIRKNVARAILFGDAPVRDNHPVPVGDLSEMEFEPPSAEGTQDKLVIIEDAPLNNEHPSKPEVSRLDPARIRRDAEYRNEYMQLILRGNRHVGS